MSSSTLNGIEPSEVRGFANALVSEYLQELSQKLATCYTNEWQMATDSASAS